MGLAVAPEISLKTLSAEIEKAPVGIHLTQFPVPPLLSLTEALVLKLIFSFSFVGFILFGDLRKGIGFLREVTCRVIGHAVIVEEVKLGIAGNVTVGKVQFIIM